MKLNIQAVSDMGRSRTNNEDMISVGGILLRDSSMELPVEFNQYADNYFYLLVSDGMGGHDKGDEASEYVLTCMAERLSEGNITCENAQHILRSIALEASTALNEKGISEGHEHVSGCTLTGIVWIGANTYLVNAGDSRTYRYRDGILKQLTTDDTEKGITGNKNASKLLLNAIGGGSHGRLAVEDITGRILCGDTILICSDGLTDMVSDEKIEEMMAEENFTADILVQTANQNGGADNISVITAQIME